MNSDGSSHDTLVMSALSVVADSSNAFNIDLNSLSSTTLTSTQQLVLAFIPGAAQGQFDIGNLSLNPSNVSAPGGVVLVDASGFYMGLNGDELIAESSDYPTPEPSSCLIICAALFPTLLARRRRFGEQSRPVG